MPTPPTVPNPHASREQRRQQRYLARPRPTFDEDLPVIHKREEIAKAISEHQVVILCGETGSGKTTQLPKICLEMGRGIDGMIGHTQPRRIAARSVAARIADQLNSAIGQAVGYKIRFGDHTSPNTYVKVMTDGILLAEIQTDRMLRQYDTLIIDEAHERSLNIDFLLGYLKQLLPKRPELKLIVTSATIDPERFSRHFSNAPILTVSGRTYPVEVLYRPVKSDDPEEEDREQTQAIVDAVRELSERGPGDVLVFLSGEREIREAAEELRNHHPPETEILPLFARLSSGDQQKIFQPHNRRRIVLATNVAETSLTVPGIKYVVDTGYARISRYSARTKVQRLPIEPISQASADQRKGRCGRVSEGICVRLYSEADFNSRAQFTEPEILRTNLASVILQMKTARLGEIEKFPFVERPDSRLIRDGYLTLHELGAVDDLNELTQLGRQLGKLPVDPRIGRMILEADRENCLSDVLVIASALSVQDPRERPAEMQQVADASHKQFEDPESDFLPFLRLWDFFREKSRHLSSNQLRKQLRQNFLSYLRMREWHEVHSQLHTVVTEMGFKPNNKPAEPDRIHRALLTGLLANVGNKTETNEYAGLHSSRFSLFPGSVLFKQRPKWVMAAEIVETQRLYARTVAKVQSEWVERAAAHLVKHSYSDPQWSIERGDVIASERVSLKGLILVPFRHVSYGRIDPRTAREIFIHYALVEGEFRTRAEFFIHNRKMLEDVRLLEAKTRRRDLLAEAKQRFGFYATRIPQHVYNAPLFERWRREAETGIPENKQPDARTPADKTPDAGSEVRRRAGSKGAKPGSSEYLRTGVGGQIGAMDRRGVSGKITANPKLLFMQLGDIATPEVAAIKPADFPDRLRIGNLTIELEYLHDTARADDGITALVPLAILNQLPAAPFEWLVPGWLHEKTVELIRTLPKAIRTRLVPAPDAAAAAIAGTSVEDRNLPFLPVIAHQLGKIIGELIPPAAFDLKAIPSWLRMNFRILDATGKSIAMGRDLVALRAELGIAARESFAAQPPSEFHQDKLLSWDFGDLPERIEIRRGTVTYSGFPAVIDQKTAVGLRVLDSREASVLANRAGVRRLFMLQLGSEIKQLARGLEGIDQMSLLYKPLGAWADLREQLLATAVDRSMFNPAEDIRSREVFVRKAKDAWNALSVATRELNRLALEILRAYSETNLALEREYPAMLEVPINEMRDQLRKLVPKEFLSVTPPDWLGHLPRYIRAIQSRLKKLLNAGLLRDQEAAATLRPFSIAYTQKRASHAARGLIDPELAKLWWMIQELRVSLFAQDLKTAFPVSVQRVERQLAIVQP